MRRAWYGICGPKRKMAPPKFWGFPKSLVWPTPMFFACALFVTGLTRTSVRLLVVSPPDCEAVFKDGGRRYALNGAGEWVQAGQASAGRAEAGRPAAPP